VEHDLERPGPPTPARGLVNGERPAQDHLLSLGDADLDELPRPGGLGDLGRHQGQRVVPPGPPDRQDLAPRADHAPPPPPPVPAPSPATTSAPGPAASSSSPPA